MGGKKQPEGSVAFKDQGEIPPDHRKNSRGPKYHKGKSRLWRRLFLKRKGNSRSPVVAEAGTALGAASFMSFAGEIPALGELEGAPGERGRGSAAEAARQTGTVRSRGMLGEAGEERSRADGRGS